MVCVLYTCICNLICYSKSAWWEPDKTSHGQNLSCHFWQGGQHLPDRFNIVDKICNKDMGDFVHLVADVMKDFVYGCVCPLSLPDTFWLLYSNELLLQVVKRGAAPEGGGEVLFRCPCKQKLRPLHFTDAGKVKRIRGVAYPWTGLDCLINNTQFLACYDFVILHNWWLTPAYLREFVSYSFIISLAIIENGGVCTSASWTVQIYTVNHWKWRYLYMCSMDSAYTGIHWERLKMEVSVPVPHGQCRYTCMLGTIEIL